MKIGEKVIIMDDQGNYLLSGILDTIMRTNYTDYEYGIKIKGDPSLLFVKLENIKPEV